MTGCTARRYDQFDTSPEAIEQELRPAFCEHRQTDRLKANYSIDYYIWSQVQQEDLDSLQRWESDWLMHFHPHKCQTMHITNKRNIIQSTYTIHNHTLQTTNTAKYLGKQHPQHPKLEYSHQQNCTESKHNFSLPPQKHSHMPTQNQTPSLHNTSSSHLRICQYHLGPTYSLQYPQT